MTPQNSKSLGQQRMTGQLVEQTGITRRLGTIENRGYGTKRLQLRDNRNRIIGYIDGKGRTFDSNHKRTGTVGTSKSTSKPWWR